MSYVYVVAATLLTTYAQVVIKWQVMGAGQFPASTYARAHFLGALLLNFWIVSAFAAAFVAALLWMVALTRLQLSHAYPIQSITFVLVLLFSWGLFDEPLTWAKVIGVSLIVCGVVIGSQG